MENMKRITEEIGKGRILVSDGAWGTFLQRKGLKPGECPELWNTANRNEVLEIAKSYVDAGADIIETNSFGASVIKLSKFSLHEKAFELNENAARISREAAGTEKFVIGSAGPTGKFLFMGEVTEEEIYNSYKIQAQAFEKGGADAICIETFYDLSEAESAVKAARENSDLEIICTFTFDKKGGDFKTMMGVSPSEAAEALIGFGVDIIGTNCGNGFEAMIEIVKEMRLVDSKIPLLVHANAGLPQIIDNILIYPETPEFISGVIPKLIDAGANIIGGCCGTTPEHIKAIVDVVGRYR